MRIAVALVAAAAALAVASPASAEPVYVETYRSLSYYGGEFDPVCGLPEAVTVEGQLLEIYHLTITASGSDLGILRQSFHGAGVGSITGAPYRVEFIEGYYGIEHFPGTELSGYYRLRLTQEGEPGFDDDMSYVIRVGYVETPGGDLHHERDIVFVDCD